MWLLKKVVSRFLFPVPLCLELLVVGLLLCFTRRQKAGKVVVALAGLLLFLFGTHFFASLLLDPLESRYPPLSITPGAPVPAGLRDVKFIVVLGAGFRGDARRPLEFELDDDSLARLTEGVRVSKVLHCCKLVVSGGPSPGRASSIAQVMAQIAQELGVDRRDMILDDQSRDTEDEARLIAPVVGQTPFILVTEASHMPRAIALFRKQGTHPIADPMGFRTTHGQPFSPLELLPAADELRNSERAVYEYLGLAFAKVRGIT
ncbi:MAG: ElyC/SanA/YdcF family protein [Terriglobia bacterium]|jgi:uncharacterized SAM-binding protein YcdF (DUF218 family)